MFDPTQEKFMQHEVRIRMLEQLTKDTKSLLRWLVAIGLSSVLIPVLLHYYKLA